jgi:hypothetical protein
MASSVAPRRRTKMDFGHEQRFRTTLGLSAGSDWREGPLARAAFGSLAIFTAIRRASLQCPLFPRKRTLLSAIVMCFVPKADSCTAAMVTTAIAGNWKFSPAVGVGYC